MNSFRLIFLCVHFLRRPLAHPFIMCSIVVHRMFIMFIIRIRSSTLLYRSLVCPVPLTCLSFLLRSRPEPLPRLSRTVSLSVLPALFPPRTAPPSVPYR